MAALQLSNFPLAFLPEMFKSMDANQLFCLAMTSRRYLEFIPKSHLPLKIGIGFQLNCILIGVSISGRKMEYFVPGRNFSDGFQFKCSGRQFNGKFFEFADSKTMETTMPEDLMLKQLFELFPTGSIEEITIYLEKNWERPEDQAGREFEFMQRIRRHLKMIPIKNTKLQCRRITLSARDLTIGFNQFYWCYLLRDIEVTKDLDVMCTFHGKYIEHMMFPPKLLLHGSFYNITLEDLDCFKRQGVRHLLINRTNWNSSKITELLLRNLTSRDAPFHLVWVFTSKVLKSEDIYSGFERYLVGTEHNVEPFGSHRVLEREDGMKLDVVTARRFIIIYNNDVMNFTDPREIHAPNMNFANP